VKNKNERNGLLMVVAVFRVPACLQVNFQMLDDLMDNLLIDYYEVRNGNTEIVLYWRQFAPDETKTVSLDLVQAFSGQCYQQPSTTYMYYQSD